MPVQSDLSQNPSDDFKGLGTVWALIALALAFAIAGAIGLSSGGCDRLSNEHARLACYDAAAHPHPAKGAAIRTTNGD